MRLAVDLGTTRARMRLGRRPVVEERAVVAVDRTRHRRVAVGDAAWRMVGRTAPEIVSVHPIQDGAPADAEATTALMRHLLHRACGPLRWLRPSTVICVSAQATTVQQRVLFDAARRAGCHGIQLLEAPLAAAVGAGLDIESAEASMVVHLGGAFTEVALISLGQIALHEVCEAAGNRMDDAIARGVRQAYGLVLTPSAAEDLKLSLGSAVPGEDARIPRTLQVLGRDPSSGLTHSVAISSADVQVALAQPLRQIADTLRHVLERIPPQLAADIAQAGVVLTGAGALLPDLDTWLSDVTGVAVRVAESPAHAALRGAAMARLHAVTQPRLARLERRNAAWLSA